MGLALRAIEEVAHDDPLMAAVIAKLPPVGRPFPNAAREAWFTLMRNAIDVAYGPEDAPSAPAAIAAPAPAEKPAPRPPHLQAGCDVYVDDDGFARCDFRRDDSGRPFPSPQRRVLAEEALGEQIYDYRGARRDRDTVTWADDARGALPGMEFCGPG